LNFKGTPSQEEHKTIFSSLKICKMGFSNQIDFPAFFSLYKMTSRNFVNTWIQQSAVAFALEDGLTLSCLENWLSGIDRLRKVNVSVTESKADCWKERWGISLTRQSHLYNL
jgi:hypothetical protein